MLTFKHRPPVVAIAAVDEAGGLAKDGLLPWHAPTDLKRFKRLTVGNGDNAVLMGRLTWESLEPQHRPLRRRRNLVLTRRPFNADGVLCVASWDEALAAAADVATLWVVGGAQIYAQGFELGHVDAVELTRISGTYGCDLFFPPIPAGFRRVDVSDREDGALRISDERWERV